MSEVSGVMVQSSTREISYPKAAGVSEAVVPSFVDALLGVLPILGEPVTTLPRGFRDGLKESPSSNLTDSGTAQYPDQLIQDQPTAKLQLSGLEDQRVQVPMDLEKTMLRVLPDSILALLLGAPNGRQAPPQPIELAIPNAQGGNQSTLVQLAAGLKPPDSPPFAKSDGTFLSESVQRTVVSKDVAKALLGFVPDSILALLMGVSNSGPGLLQPTEPSVPSGSKSVNGKSGEISVTLDDLLANLVGGASMSKPLAPKGGEQTLDVLQPVWLPNYSSGLPKSIAPTAQSAQDGQLSNESTRAQFKAVDVGLLDLSLVGTGSNQELGSQSAKTDGAKTQVQPDSKLTNGTPDQTAITLEDLVNLVVGTEVSKPLDSKGGGQALRADQLAQLKVARAPVEKPLIDHLSAKLEGTVLLAQVPQAGSVVSSPDVPPPMATTIDPEAVLRQVGRYLKVTLDGKHSEIRFQLHPDELGAVDVKLTLHDGLVRAELTAQNSAVKAVLDSNLEQLRSRLSAQGLNVDQLNVTVGSDDLTGSRQQQEQQRGQRRKVPWLSEEHPEMAPDDAKQVWAAPRADPSRRRINALV